MQKRRFVLEELILAADRRGSWEPHGPTGAVAVPRRRTASDTRHSDTSVPTLTILLFEVYLPVFVFGDGTTSANDASAHIINIALVTYIDMLLTDSIRVNVSMWADSAQTNKAFSKRCDSSKTENRIQI